MKESIVARNRIAVYVPNHPAANGSGYILRSRCVMEKHLGRMLSSSEHIHHINGVHDDDRIKNLQVVSRSEHIKIHKPWDSIPNKLDYELIEQLMAEGLGCRRIARQTGYSLSGVKQAMQKIRRA